MKVSMICSLKTRQAEYSQTSQNFEKTIIANFSKNKQLALAYA